MGKKKVNIAYIVLKIIMFVLIAFFATDANMQRKLADCYSEAECKIFHGIKHEDYFVTDEVVQFVIENVIK
ncbi:MAG: hypothetical protein K6G45_00755 [Lachnospiraceae bacterium]|nr:hypothetical protein [Lachnospiraceae bacterium]